MRLVCLVLLLHFAAQAQPTRHFYHFTDKNGLSDNRVQCILRDRSGFLWVGTAKGLNRFDGYSFKQYLPDSRQTVRTVSNDNIHDIKEDTSGYIWIATSNGLNRYDPRTETFSIWKNTGRDNGSLPNSLVWSLYIDAQNRVWLACDNRDLCYLDPATYKFVTRPWKAFVADQFRNIRSDEYTSIWGIRRRGERDMWLLSNKGLYVFDAENGTFEYHGNAPGKWHSSGSDASVSSIEALPWQDSIVWLANHAEAGPNQRDAAPSGRFNAWFREKNGAFWLGGEKGLWQYDPAAQHFVHSLPAAPDENHNSCRLLDSRTSRRRYVANLYEGQLTVYEGQRLVGKIRQPDYCGLLYEAPEGQVWVGFGKKIFLLHPASLQLVPFPVPEHLLDPSVSSSYFHCMDRDAGGRYWIGNNKEGLLVWDPDKHVWWKPGVPENFISKGVRDICADRDRRCVWIATEDYGLFRYDERTGKFTLYQPDDDHPDNAPGAYITNAVCKDGLGNIWIATDPGGVSRFSYDAPPEKQFINLHIENGLPSNQVNTLLTDNNGHVWAGTSKGLARIDVRSLRVLAFGLADGMIQENIDQPLTLSAQGEICCGTAYGFQSFFPERLLQEKTDEEVLLTDFKIFDKKYSDSLNIHFVQKVDLRRDQNFFSFEFASTNFSQPQKNEFAYRLKGYDTDWNYLKNSHSASYTNVPPGDYLLEIKTGRAGLWYEPVRRLAIHIDPPFWGTVWFRVVVVLLLAGCVWNVYRWRIAQVRREESLKSAFQQTLARTEMAALRAQMNPHFVFNCLSSINRFIIVHQPEQASVYLTKFSRLIRLILDNSRTETVPLNRELEALQLYVQMEQMRFSDRFEFRLEIAEGVQTEHLELPPLLIQPYVENAIWHGLMHKKEPGLLLVRIGFQEKKLCIEVEDNGVGRQRASELKSRSAVVNKSHGMQLTAERLAVINQLYGADASVTTIDLPEGAGTKVILTLQV